jgi:hypothetical protein
MGWAWLIILLATYPWLLGADLLSDLLAPSALLCFITGACLIAPCQRLPRWQCVLFAAATGFLFEARRPIPDGLLALALVAAAIFLSSNRPLLRSVPRALQAAAIVNGAACLCWLAGVAFVTPGPAGELNGHAFTQFGCALLLGFLALAPVAATQHAVMDRLGVAPAADQP